MPCQEGSPTLALGSADTGRACHLPFQQQRWAPCSWVGGRVSCQLTSIICSSFEEAPPLPALQELKTV